MDKDVLSKDARLRLIYAVLAYERPCSTLDQAMLQIASVINEIEDEYTSIPYNPTGLMDGRIYPPEYAGLVGVKGNPKIKCYRHTRHNTFFGVNGSFKMQMRLPGNKLGEVVFEKRGADGKGVDEQ